jgi:hypothetical protein
VFDPQARQWSYVDAYTDVLLPGVSAAALAEGRVAAASTPMVQVVAPHMRGLFGEVVPLGRLFRYRVYADTLTRLQHISMLRMNATPVGEQGYGLGWTLNVAEPREASELFPERLTIHVRARYVVAGARTVRPLEQPAQALESSEQPAASPWGAAQFEIAPRAIMAAYPAPQRASKPNICEVLKAEAKPLIGPFRSEGNIAYWVESPVRDAGDSLAAPRRSPLVVCEDGQPLGPAHSVHEQIMTQGRGRFSHWGGTLYFSASDNSDPNRNGRSYHVVMPNP